MKNIFRSKNIKWEKIIFALIGLLNVALFLTYVITGVIDDSYLASGTVPSFMKVTFFINIVYIVYNLVVLFWKKKNSNILYAYASAAFIVFFYIIRLCLIWY